jgi:GT2 family glycosyltransferase
MLLQKNIIKMKFSVVIPTIWKGEEINKLLTSLYECDKVADVILINNDKSKTINFPKNDKLNYIEPETNLFVNPSWNLGVKLAKYDNIIISNDDVLFNVEYFTNILEYLASQASSLESFGIIGMGSDNYDLEEDFENASIRPYSNSYNKGGWACLFAFHKNSWKDIPETVKIYYGDNFIHMVCSPILELVGLKIKTKMSSSADTKVDWVKEVTDNDTKEWHKLLGI